MTISAKLPNVRQAAFKCGERDGARLTSSA